MKKIEIIFSVIFLTTTALYLANLQGGAILLMTLSSFVLGIIYTLLSVPLFNNTSLKLLFDKKNNRHLTIKKVLGSIAFGGVLAISLLGILFKLGMWPGASILQVLSLTFTIILTIVAFIVSSKPLSLTMKSILRRIALWSTLNIIIFLMPTQMIVEIKYRNHPHIINAFKAMAADPQNKELQFQFNREMMEIENRSK